jgi:parvulin-like peptidyl-prolyl isomerase
MTRRFTATVVVVAAGVAALSACGGSRDSDAAAVVDGTAIPRSEYESLMQSVTANPEVFGIEEDFATNTIDGEAGRSLLQVLVLAQASEDYLAAEGEAVTDADRQAILDAIGPNASQVPQDVLDLEVERQARQAAFGRLAAASGAAQAAWEASPADVGQLCVRHLLVETEEEAQDVLAELDGGADFAELAAERSVDPSAASNGGALEVSPEQPCIPLTQAQSALDPVFLQAATGAVPGELVGPVETSFGWHVIQARPYEEVAVAVDAAVGERAFLDYLGNAEIEVDPRYGRWDAVAVSVVALDTPEPSIPTP